MKREVTLDNSAKLKELLTLFNTYIALLLNSPEVQIRFENALAELNGVERDELSMLMDTYIDLDISGADSATLEDLKQIVIESRMSEDGNEK